MVTLGARGVLLALALAAPASALNVPALRGRVNDQAGLLSPFGRQNLEIKLQDLETRTGHQVAVLTLTSLEGEVLETYSLKVARTWGLGRKGVNNGVLFLISKSDRKLRIEVGHGLEGAIPDALAGRIIQDVVVPQFRAGNFEGGIAAGADAIISAAEGTYAPPPPPPWRKLFAGGIVDAFETGLGLLVFFIAGLIMEYEGIVEPGGSRHYFTLAGLWLLVIGLPFGLEAGLKAVFAHLLGYPILKFLIPRTPFGRKLRARNNNVYYGKKFLFTTRSGGSSGGGGWSSGGGGGFSGGGGSFGGGGSSGSW
ncbi:MAG: TPM domain-containing protein [Elusimicrobia bacterium]|nr:TPM domain-containing protein [Elusimicrobiota bacterium]